MKRISFFAILASVLLLFWSSPAAYPMMHPAQGRFLQRDPAGYVDGMNSYECVGSKPGSLRDPGGMAATKATTTRIWESWEPVAENQYRAKKDGAELRQLSQLVLQRDSSWRCIWPIETPDEPKSRRLYKQGRAACDDVYDVSNLTAEDGPTIEGVFVGKNARWGNRAAAVGFTGYTKTFDTGDAIVRELRELSQEGKRPIGSFTLFSHGNRDHSLHDGGAPRQHLYINDLQGSGGDSFDRARQKKGPAICWFRPGATVRFVGCKTAEQARQWATRVLRTRLGDGGAWGVTRYLQALGSQGRFLEGLHQVPSTRVPWVTYGELLKQEEGWAHYRAAR